MGMEKCIRRPHIGFSEIVFEEESGIETYKKRKIRKGAKLIVCLLALLTLLGCGPKRQVLIPSHRDIDTFKVGIVQKKMLGETMLERENAWVRPGFVATMDYRGIKNGTIFDCSYLLKNGDYLCGTINHPVEVVIKPSGIFYGSLNAFFGFVVADKGAPPNLLKKIDIWQKGSFKEQLNYNGKSKESIKMSYREYKDDMARLAFYQDLTYDLSDSKIIGFRDVLIEVIEATNINIEFIVKSKK